MEANSMKAMREAVGKALWCLNWMDENTSNEVIKDHLAKPIELLTSALSAPPTISEEYAKPALCKTCAHYTADGCEICGCTEYQEKEEANGSK